jgi:hypothetical protein
VVESELHSYLPIQLLKRYSATELTKLLALRSMCCNQNKYIIILVNPICHLTFGFGRVSLVNDPTYRLFEPPSRIRFNFIPLRLLARFDPKANYLSGNFKFEFSDHRTKGIIKMARERKSVADIDTTAAKTRFLD